MIFLLKHYFKFCLFFVINQKLKTQNFQKTSNYVECLWVLFKLKIEFQNLQYFVDFVQ